jgi:peroxiredoxin
MVAILFLAAVPGLIRAGGDKDKSKAADKDVMIQGKLGKDDGKDEQRGGPSQIHVVPMKAGKVYTIDMVSGDFDSYLRLLDPKGKQLDEDDDSGGMLNSRIIFNCPADGDYRIATTTFGPDMAGAYTLTVKTSGALQKPITAHAKLIGGAAPGFDSSFAVGGKAVALGDLKGKVVLLHFCDIRSAGCVAGLPQLNQWHKAYKDRGLVIVGVTFYPSEINQNLGFDRDSGKIVDVKRADQKSDQALLQAFAEHHKIEYPLMALPAKEAVSAFDAYAVNGVPQLVVIDRGGLVRQVDLAGAKNAAALEGEFKKLLTEK